MEIETTKRDSEILVNGLREELSSIQSALSIAQESIRQFETTSEMMSNQIKTLEAELRVSKENVVAKEAALIESNVTSNRLQSDLVTLQMALATSSEEQNKHHLDNLSSLKAANERVLQLELEAEGTSNELKRNAELSFEKDEQIRELEEQSVSLRSELDQLNSQVAAASVRISQLEGDLVAAAAGPEELLVRTREELARITEEANVSKR